MSAPRKKTSAKVARRAPTRRPYDATSTRTAILSGARRLFTDRGFDHVGLREIAAIAGVDPALAIRYFGSKEKLFLAAIGSDFDLLDYWGDDKAAVGLRLAARILEGRENRDCYDPLLLILRSAPNACAASLLKEKMQSDVIDPIAARLVGADASLRASMIAALLVGLAFVKDVIHVDGTAKAPRDRQLRLYADLIQRCVDGDPAPARRGARESNTRRHQSY